MIKLISGKNFNYLKKTLISFSNDQNQYNKKCMSYNFSTLKERQDFIKKFESGKHY